MFLPADLNIIDAGALAPSTAPWARWLPCSWWACSFHMWENRQSSSPQAVEHVIALVVSWWSELVVGLGLAGGRCRHRDPGTFLILPLSAVGTFLIAAVLGSVLPPADLEKSPGN